MSPPAPTVTPNGTKVFKGTTYNKYQVTFSNPKAWANGSPGVAPGGAAFHVGEAFSEADFTVPDSVIIVQIALLDAGGTPLTLQPRMAGYDTGALDASDGSYRMNFFNADDPARPLLLRDVVVSELPMVASIDSMLRGNDPKTRYGLTIRPWKSQSPLCQYKPQATTDGDGCPVRLTEEQQTITLARLAQGRNVAQVYDGKCPSLSQGGTSGDSSKPPDVNRCPNAGVSLDLFPATVLYVTATVVDPNAKHWDPVQKQFVVGPLESHLFYQIAGRHPDLNRNGIDDYIDILQGHSKDTNGDGVPDEVQHCLKQLSELDKCEAKEGDLERLWVDAERREVDGESCQKFCHGKPGEEACEKECDQQAEKLDHNEHELDESLRHQKHECREALHRFKHCEEEYQERAAAR